MVFSSQFAALAGASAPKPIKTATIKDQTQPNAYRMTELRLTADTLPQLFPAAADSYTALRPMGLVTPFAALHHFPRESDSRAASRAMRTADECPKQEAS